MNAKIIPFPAPKLEPDPATQERSMAMPVGVLLDKLAFLDKSAKIYVRCGWMAGVMMMEYRPDGAYGQPTLFLYLNQEELPPGARG